MRFGEVIQKNPI